MHRQRGSLLIELSVVLLLGLLLAVGSVSWLKQRAEQQKIEQLALWMRSVQTGVQHYLEANAKYLVAHTPEFIVGFNNVWQPTVAELVAAQYLPTQFITSSQVHIGVRLSDCTTEQRCYAEALIVYDQPLLNAKAQPDSEALAHWLRYTQSTGLVVRGQQPQWFSAADRRVANPYAPLTRSFPAGSVALQASTDHSHLSYLRIRDPRNPEFQADVDIAQDLRVGQDLHVSRFLTLPHTEQPDTACSLNGALARNHQALGLLLCDTGRWQPISQQVPDAVTVKLFFEQVLGWVDNPLPFYEFGYYGESLADRGNKACWLHNPLYLGCGCPLGSKASGVLRNKDLTTYYAGIGDRVGLRTVFIHGCEAL